MQAKAAESSGYAEQFRCFWKRRIKKTVCLNLFILNLESSRSPLPRVWFQIEATATGNSAGTTPRCGHRARLLPVLTGRRITHLNLAAGRYGEH